MNYRPLDSLKPLAAQLAELITSGNPDQTRIGELLKRMRVPSTGKTKGEVDRASGQDLSGSIGIWKKKTVAGTVVYQRDTAKKKYWGDWADTDILCSKGTRRRVLLFGESVARGYFFDPFYNVAKELQSLLDGVPDGRDIEVIDLATTGQTFAELLALSRSGIALEPDMAIFFAGNNWSRDILPLLFENSYNTILASFRGLGLNGIRQLLEGSAQRMTTELFFTIEDNFLKKGIPVTMIIPEFNLKDWKSDEKENALAWLPEGCMEKWIEMKDVALAAMSANDPGRLGMAATKMVALFPSNPMSHELLDRFYLLKGNHKEARACFGRSRDAVLLSGTAFKPRCLKMIRDQLLVQAGKTGVEIVDLASIFEGANGMHIADRAEFMDYCHLTVEGIKTAMRHTAQKVIRILCKRNIEIDGIPESGLFPEKHVSAIAHFSAAIHNAHGGQSAEVLQYHCNKSIGYSSKIKEIMLQYVDFSTRRASSHFCASYAELIRSGEMYQYEGGRNLMHGPGMKTMDISLVDAITTALKPVVPGVQDKIDQLRKSEHGVTVQGIDLLESFYSKTSYNYYFDEGECGLYQARTLESDFHFILRKPGDPLQFEIGCRLPGAGPSKRLIGIRMNDGDHDVAGLPASGDWITHSFRVEPEHLVDGVNKLSIKWPFFHRAMPHDLSTSFNRILKIIFPVIGEISSFVVKLSGRSFLNDPIIR